MKGSKPIDPKIRLFRKVKKTKSCWNWTGATSKGRYGSIGIGSRTDGSKKIIKVHRLSWEIFNGPIPNGLHVLHKCDNTICVNPKHLWLGTHLDNMKDMTEKKRYVVYKGSENLNSKLTERQVRQIRKIYRPFKMTQKMLAEKFKVSRTTIGFIIYRRNWKHLA